MLPSPTQVAYHDTEMYQWAEQILEHRNELAAIEQVQYALKMEQEEANTMRNQVEATSWTSTRPVIKREKSPRPSPHARRSG